MTKAWCGPVTLVLFGICVGYPTVVLPPFADGNGPRLTDIANICGALLLVATFAQGRPLHGCIKMLLTVWLLSFGWLLAEAYYSYAETDPTVQRALLRWMWSIFGVYWLIVARETAGRLCVCAGIVIGTLLSLGTVARDYLSFDPQAMDPELLVRLAIYNGKAIQDVEYRASGIFGHPNGAAGCILVAIPILLGLVEEKLVPRITLLLGVALAVAVFLLTKSRGSLGISLGLLTYWVLVCAPSKVRWISVGLFCTSGAALLAWLGHQEFADSPLIARFIDSVSISENADDRWWTISAALDLIVRHPLGMASSYGALLREATGTDATHNAILELALLGGVPLAVFVTVRLIKVASLLTSAWRPVEAWLAAYLIGIFLFETYFVQVNIAVLTLWALWQPSCTVGGAEHRGRQQIGLRLPPDPAIGAMVGRPR